MIGQNVNNFEVRGLIGQGETGWVYLAQHPIIGRKAALKVVRREFCQDEAAIAQFLHDARAANALEHPNIASMLDVGRLPDGLPYVLMELLEGETLAARLRRLGRLTLDEALAILDLLSAALGAAHRRGIVHGHLKPANIFLTQAAEGREGIKLLDFGVARLRIDTGGGGPAGGAQLGTPIYLSPEQCRGDGAPVDARADVYALGTILYEMLCGRPPFLGPAPAELIALHLAHPPPAPRVWNPAMPPAIEAVILRALAKDPGDRYASMAETWEALLAAAAAPNDVLPLAAAAAPARQPPAQVLTPAPISVPATPPGGTVWSAPVAEITAVVRPLTRRARRLMLPAMVLAVGIVAGLSAINDSRQRERRQQQQRADDQAAADRAPALARGPAPAPAAPPPPPLVPAPAPQPVRPTPVTATGLLATRPPGPAQVGDRAGDRAGDRVRPARRRPLVRIARPAHVRRRPPAATRSWMDKW